MWRARDVADYPAGSQGVVALQPDGAGQAFGGESRALWRDGGPPAVPGQSAALQGEH